MFLNFLPMLAILNGLLGMLIKRISMDCTKVLLKQCVDCACSLKCIICVYCKVLFLLQVVNGLVKCYYGSLKSHGKFFDILSM